MGNTTSDTPSDEKHSDGRIEVADRLSRQRRPEPTLEAFVLYISIRKMGAHG